MKVRRLAGYGPIAAYVSAGSLLVYFILQQTGTLIVSAAPFLFVPLAIAFVIALFVWVAGLAVAMFDLESLAHPATSTASIRIARFTTLVALVMPLPIGLAPFTFGVNLQAPSFLLLFVGVAITLVVHNLEGRRAGLMHSVLPWLGIATGAVYVVAGLAYMGILIPTIGMTVFMVGLNVSELAEILYIVWAIWMGVQLTRSKTSASAAPRAASA